MNILRVLVALWVGSCVSLGARGEAPVPGELSPELGIEELLNAPDGAEATLDSLRGKIVVLEFWATWCGPCIAAIPHLNELRAEFEDRGVVFISVTDENRRVVERFQEHSRSKVEGWVAIDSDGSLAKAYNVRGIPHTVVLDGYGRVASITDPRLLTKGRIEAFLTGHRDVAMPEPAQAVKPQETEDGDDAVTLRNVQPGNDPLDMTGTDVVYQVIVRRSPEAVGSTRVGLMGEAETSLGRGPRQLLSKLFGVSPEFVDMDGVDDDTRYDLIATSNAGQGILYGEVVREALLNDLGVTAEVVERELDGFRLVQVGSGHMLEEVEPTGGWFSTMGASLTSPAGSVGTIANWVQRLMRMPVDDATGLDRERSFYLDLGPAEHGNLESVRTVLREQAGLTLESVRLTRDVLVVRPDKGDKAALAE